MGKELSANSTLSHYRIVSKIGAGGMGEVYLAHDTKLDRRVALKVLPPDVAADRTRMLRFIQEAKAASALNHPNIITIHEIEQIDSVNFIATEFIDGETLRERMRHAPMILAEILEFAIQAASALSAAHTAGIIHRDIKPENIMVRRDGYIKVLDFGLAKLVEPLDSLTNLDAPTKALVNTDAGTVVGTAVYMSPEQAKGVRLDERTDLWSLGAVIYEMVTGRVPFLGETTPDTISLILQREPAPLTRYAQEVPAELERIVKKTLTKNCDERYQSAKDLLIDLRNLKRQLEVDAEIDRTISPGSRSSLATTSTGGIKSTPANVSGRAATDISGVTQTVPSAGFFSRSKHHKLLILVTVVVLGLVALAVAAFLRAGNVDVPVDSIAVLPFENRSSDSEADYLSDGLAESLIYRLSQLPNLRVTPTSLALHYKGRQADAAQIGKELGVSAILLGRITKRGDSLTISAELVDVRKNKLLWGEHYESKMSDLLATQREIAREIVENLKLKVSGEEKGIAKHYTESNEAYQFYLRGRFYWNKRTEEGMQKALESFQQAIEKDPGFALAYSGLADTYALLGASEASGGQSPTEAMPRAKSAALKALEIDDTLAEPYVSLAHVNYYYDRDWAAAERRYKRAIELNPNYPTAHQWYAVYLMSAGRFEEALAETRRALELDPLSLPINMTLGWVLLNARQYDQSAEQLRKTLEMDRTFVLAHHRLGVVYELQGKYNEAIAEFNQVVNLSAGKPLGLASLGRAYALSGKRAEAQKLLAELQELSKQRYVSPVSIALIYAALGDKVQSFAWLEKADTAHDANLTRLKVDPRFDSLRSDPRFTDLMRRVGLQL